MGKIHYSNTPAQQAKSVDLPEIRKENLAKKIETIKKETPKNCLSRGGVDCSQGADKDGSVFCLDGYSESKLAFNSYCLKAQLEAEISFNDLNDDSYEVSIVLRNLSPVEANNISLVYHYRQAFTTMGKKMKLPLVGEKVISAYGLETYKASFKKHSKIITKKALERGRPVLSCDNCKPLRKKL